MFNKTKHKNKKRFCRYYLQCFSSKRVLVEHKEICLKINGKQTAKLRSGLIKFKNLFKQFVLPFKIYAFKIYSLMKFLKNIIIEKK